MKNILIAYNKKADAPCYFYIELPFMLIIIWILSEPLPCSSPSRFSFSLFLSSSSSPPSFSPLLRLFSFTILSALLILSPFLLCPLRELDDRDKILCILSCREFNSLLFLLLTTLVHSIAWQPILRIKRHKNATLGVFCAQE